MATDAGLTNDTTVKANKNQFNQFHGEHFIDDELRELGLSPETEHIKIEFDNENTRKWVVCKSFMWSLSTIYLWILWPFFIPCIMYGAKAWVQSRKAAVTNKQIVFKQGYYGCCCCCWNEKVKTVPLDKITDLQIQQGCIQRCYNIKEIRVETASANQQVPEMSLVGITEPDEIRQMVLQMRDDIQGNGSANVNNAAMSSLLNNKSYGTDPNLVEINNKQHETLIEIRDLLVSVDAKLTKNRDEGGALM